MMRAAVYYLDEPELIPLITIPVSVARVIYDSHKDLGRADSSEEVHSAGAEPGVAILSRPLCKFANRSANHIVAASPIVAERFLAGNCMVILNYPEVVADCSGYAHRVNRVVDAGALSMAHYQARTHRG